MRTLLEEKQRILRSLDLQIKSLRKDINSKEILLQQWEFKKTKLELELSQQKAVGE